MWEKPLGPSFGLIQHISVLRRPGVVFNWWLLLIRPRSWWLLPDPRLNLICSSASSLSLLNLVSFIMHVCSLSLLFFDICLYIYMQLRYWLFACISFILFSIHCEHFLVDCYNCVLCSAYVTAIAEGAFSTVKETYCQISPYCPKYLRSVFLTSCPTFWTKLVFWQEKWFGLC